MPAPVVVTAPDSFKGSLFAEGVTNAIVKGIRRARPDAQIRISPMTDGGEGTLDAILETAEMVGITDPDSMAVPVTERSTLGMGEAIRALLDTGARKFFVVLGGSSTNDGGAGLLVGLGLKLFDAHGAELEPVPSALAKITRIDVSGLDGRVKEAEFVGMSDVDNPLNGDHGATAIFGPQKGVMPEQIVGIDATLAHFANVLEPAMAVVKRNEPGAGAAGGLSFALHMLGARFETGAEVVAREIGLDAALKGTGLITGEDRSDMQTLHGKAVHSLQARARCWRAGDAALGCSGSGGAAASVGTLQRLLRARAGSDPARRRDSRCRAPVVERSRAVDAAALRLELVV
ncbi:Glycerate kinase [Candidatus Paraburkholderia calva]|nr:Glycerate kinase [Candidatus Paraburkholderia calva]